MWRSTLTALGFLAGGCDAVWGLSTVRSTGVDAALDTPVEPIVTGTHRLRYLSNDASFKPVVIETQYPLGEIAMTAFLDDGTAVAVDYRSDGTFSFPLAYAGQRYRLVITAESRTSEFQHTASHLELAALWAGRRDARPTGYVAVNVPFPDPTTAGSSLFLASTGLWTHTDTGLYGPNAKFDWRLIAWLGHQGLLDSSEHDRLYAFELTSFAVAGSAPTYIAIKAASSASVDQVSGGSVALPQPGAISHDACIHITAANVAETARIQQVTGKSYAALQGDWVVYNVPAPDQTQLVGPIWVALDGQAPVVDLDLAPTFYDPFPGGELVVQSGALAGFDTLLPGTTGPVRQYDLTRRYHKIARSPLGNCGPAHDLPPTIAIAGGATLGGIALDADNKDIALDLSHDVSLAWTLAAPGAVHTTTVGLYELDAAGTTTTSVFRRALTIVGTSAAFDRSLLQVGHTYMIAITSSLGYPQAGSGDIVTLAWPIEVSTTWSHSFRVQAL